MPSMSLAVTLEMDPVETFFFCRPYPTTTTSSTSWASMSRDTRMGEAVSTVKVWVT